MAPKLQLSGIQKQVLGLYRGFLRAARLKAPEERRKIEEIVSTEFRRNKGIDRKNFLYIEYLIRQGNKQLDQLNSPDTVGLSTLKVSPSAAANKSSPADSQSDVLNNKKQQPANSKVADMKSQLVPPFDKITEEKEVATLYG